MKIGFFELEAWEERLIRQELHGEEVTLVTQKITQLCLPQTKDYELISVFVDSRIDKTVLDCFPNLKCIATRSTGYDHIDIAECKKRGIAVLYVPGYGDNTVAEFTFGLILNLTRKLYQSIDQIKETGSFSLTGLRGVDIKGKTIGIVGTGRIGREVVRIAKGFGMDILAYDPRPDDALAKETGFSYVTLDELFSRSDIISLHCPYNKDTHHLINKTNIGKIKKGAYLVNTARGPIVETEALVDALQKGILAGAGLDVLEEEGETKDELTILALGHPQQEELKTMLENHILMRMPNVLVSPHNAFNSKEALERILAMTLMNIKSYLSGKLQNIVP